MLFPDITAALNRKFGTPGKVAFRAGSNNLPLLVLANNQATAEISLYGAHVLAYRPIGQLPVLFVSNASAYEPGKPLRGGVPLSWPWFSTPDTPALPDHGFAFTSLWQLHAVEHSADESKAVLVLQDAAASWRLWPHPFRLTLTVTVGASLKLEMTTDNLDTVPVTIAQGFHTYFKVRDIENVTLHGLENTPFYNKALREMAPPSDEPVTVHAEIDRVYFPTTATCVIDDPGLRRRIKIDKSGSNSTVVWNPWGDKTKRIRDFEPDDFRTMFCVETTNTRDDKITLPAGGTHTLSATITSELV